MNRWTQDWQTNGHAKQITRQIYGLCIAVLSCGFLIADNIVHCRICNFQHHCLCIHNWSMPCHATLYHVMAFDRCNSVIINSYSLAAIHSTAICFISYQQFFYLFFFYFSLLLFVYLAIRGLAADLLRSFCSLFFRQSVVVAAVVVGIFFFGTFRIF